MKNEVHGLISRLDTAEERISGLEDISIESLNTKKYREQRLEKTIPIECITPRMNPEIN